MNIKIYLYTTLISINLYPYFSSAIIYTLPENDNRLVGKNIEIVTPKNNIHPLEYFSAKFQVGISNMLEANPNTDVYLPNSETKLIIPHKLILPDTPHLGIVINNAEMRLYYYPKHSHTVVVLPVAIGTIDNATPLQWVTSIKSKKKPNLDTYQKYAR